MRIQTPPSTADFPAFCGKLLFPATFARILLGLGGGVLAPGAGSQLTCGAIAINSASPSVVASQPCRCGSRPCGTPSDVFGSCGFCSCVVFASLGAAGVKCGS